MKRLFILTTLLLALQAGHASAALTVDPMSLTLSSGESATLTLSGGSGFYNIQSSDTSVATVSFTGNLATVVAVTKGSITVTVQDGTDTVSVSVDVDPYMSVSADEVHMLEGEIKTVTVANGVPPFTVVATPMVTADLSAGVLTITGSSKGKATVTVTDSVADSVTVDVVVYLPLSVDPTAVNLAENTTATIVISEGVEPYTAVSKNTSVITASLAVDTVTVEGISKGSTYIAITDSAIPPNVITVDAGVSTFNVSTKDLSVQMGTTASIDILGSGYFNLSTDPANIVSAVISGNSILLTPSMPGNATITISDSTGESIDIKVAVFSDMSLSKSDFKMNEGSTESILISGGVWPYAIVSSSPGIVDVPSKWGVMPFDVKAGNPGSTTITVTDSAGNSASIDVTVLPVGVGLSEQSISVSPGGKGSVSVFGGTGYYTLIVNDPAVADASLGTDDVIDVTGIATGKTKVTVQDSDFVSIELTVFTLLPSPALDLAVTGKNIKLDWDAISGADEYWLYYAPPDAKGKPDTGLIGYINLGNVTSIDGDLSSGDSFFVGIQAVDSSEPDLASAISNIVDFTIP